MKKLITSLTRKKFSLDAGNDVVFEASKKTIKIKPAKTTLKAVYSSVKPLKKKISFEKMKGIALKEKFIDDRIRTIF